MANLNRLRDKLSDELNDILTAGEPYTDRDGNVVMVDGRPLMKRPTSATLNVIRQFLKDNGYDRDPIETPTSRPVTDTLPFAEDSKQFLDYTPPPTESIIDVSPTGRQASVCPADPERLP